jgi:site-specific DNA-cytosine methylase
LCVYHTPHPHHHYLKHILSRCGPRAFILENVTALEQVSTDDGLTSDATFVVDTFGASGYSSRWFHVDAARQGSCANRERFQLQSSSTRRNLGFEQYATTPHPPSAVVPSNPPTLVYRCIASKRPTPSLEPHPRSTRLVRRILRLVCIEWDP